MSAFITESLTIPKQQSYPLRIHLPEGWAESLIDSGWPPKYAINGVMLDGFDPTIPEDLWEVGWFWHGAHFVNTERFAGLVIAGPKTLAEYFASARTIEETSVQLRLAREGSKPSRQAAAAAKVVALPRAGRVAQLDMFQEAA